MAPAALTRPGARHRRGDFDAGLSAGFIDVTEFGPGAAASARTLSRGWLVAAHGRLEHREWEKDGHRHSAIGIVGRIEFLAAPRAAQPVRPEAAAPSAATAEEPWRVAA